MSRAALSCIACGGDLVRIFDDAENQPEDGTAFTSYGHYGSTVFDPMDGSELEINVCDKCLREAATNGQVLHGRTRTPVTCYGMYVGYADAEWRPVHWHPDIPSDGRGPIEVEPDELGDFERYPEITWHGRAVLSARKHAAAILAAEEDDG